MESKWKYHRSEHVHWKNNIENDKDVEAYSASNKAELYREYDLAFNSNWATKWYTDGAKGTCHDSWIPTPYLHPEDGNYDNYHLSKLQHNL